MSFPKLDTNKSEWNLSLLFSDDKDKYFELVISKAREESYKFINKWKERNDYLSQPEVLLEALQEYEIWSKEYGVTGGVSYYLGLKSAQDETNPELKAKINKLHESSVKISNDLQFFELNIAKIPKNEQEKFLNYEGLKDFHHLLERFFIEGAHFLTDKEEKILNLKEKTSLGNWIRLVSELLVREELDVLDDDGKKCKKSFSEVVSLTSNKNKGIRKKAAQELEKVFVKHLLVAEAEINTVCENKMIDDQLRGYSRPDEARHLADDVSSAVVDEMLAEVSSCFALSQKFYKFKAELLGQKKLEYYERSVEYSEVEKKYSYEEAATLVYEVLANLDGEFAEIFKKYVENGQLDVFPRKGKSDGAFCACERVSSPTYILLNHNKRLVDVLTMAHEVGHGINNELIKKTQNNLNFGTPTSTAEVASTFMEDFVLQHLLQEANPEEELAIRMLKLDSDIASIFRQVAFYNFEMEMHESFREKGYLTAENIGELFRKHMQSYLGSSAQGSENWWLYVGHFRMYFYVYSYASGLLISKALQAQVRKDKEFIQNVKYFLGIGLSSSPKDSFLRMGINIEDKGFWKEGLNEIETYLNGTMALAKRLKKIK